MKYLKIFTDVIEARINDAVRELQMEILEIKSQLRLAKAEIDYYKQLYMNVKSLREMGK